MASLSERIEAIRTAIAARGRDPDDITIVAVTKGFDVEVVERARAAGLTDVGENYAPDLLHKASGYQDLTWHFLGAVQRNKVRALAPVVDVWQTLSREVEASTIARYAPGTRVFVQVNISGEPQKHGCGPAECLPLVESLRRAGLDVRGLMGVAPRGSPEEVRRSFRSLAGLQRDAGVTELSIGMSGDYEIAVEEGATMLRLGTALFGPRPSRY